MVSCQKGPTRHAYAWQIWPFWQDTLDLLAGKCFESSLRLVHDDVMTLKLFLHYRPFVMRSSPATGYPHLGPVMRSFHVLFTVSLNQLLNKPSI